MSHDLIVIGGGLAGAVLAERMARHGCKVLVIERETRFKDRVRGENMLPWGVDAARRLGVYETLMSAGGHQPAWWTTYNGGHVFEHRDLRATTVHGQTALNIYHPAMQEALLQRAIDAGADVRRGARATALAPAARGGMPTLSFENGGAYTAPARVVVGADGRSSQVRSWGGFEVSRHPDLLSIAGMLVEDSRVPDDSIHLSFGPGIASFIAPLGHGRMRTYFVYPGVAGKRGLSGPDKTRAFLELVGQTGVPQEWLNGVRVAGPLAEFEGADHWIDAPARSGLALIGDAASSSDPSWGCGLSLTLLDVEALSRALSSTSDWDAALARYAQEHDVYASALRRILSWMTELVWTPGPAAEERRRRVFGKMKLDPRGYPDSVGHGPFGPSDEAARRLILGEEEPAAAM